MAATGARDPCPRRDLGVLGAASSVAAEEGVGVRKRMVFQGIVTRVQLPDSQRFLGSIEIHVNADGAGVLATFAIVPTHGYAPMVGTPVFVEYQEYDGVMRQFDYRATRKRTKA